MISNSVDLLLLIGHSVSMHLLLAVQSFSQP